jgi:hypothetical protein
VLVPVCSCVATFFFSGDTNFEKLVVVRVVLFFLPYTTLGGIVGVERGGLALAVYRHWILEGQGFYLRISTFGLGVGGATNRHQMTSTGLCRRTQLEMGEFKRKKEKALFRFILLSLQGFTDCNIARYLLQ